MTGFAASRNPFLHFDWIRILYWRLNPEEAPFWEVPRRETEGTLVLDFVLVLFAVLRLHTRHGVWQIEFSGIVFQRDVCVCAFCVLGCGGGGDVCLCLVNCGIVQSFNFDAVQISCISSIGCGSKIGSPQNGAPVNRHID